MASSPSLHMAKAAEDRIAPAEWVTFITQISRDSISIAGYSFPGVIKNKSILETLCLLVTGEFPDPIQLIELEEAAFKAIRIPATDLSSNQNLEFSQKVVKLLLFDEPLTQYSAADENSPLQKTAFGLGRVIQSIASVLDNGQGIKAVPRDQPFLHALYQLLTGQTEIDPPKVKLLEAMIVACSDHGVSAPSTQITILAASTRAAYELAVAQGLASITDVHGGAGAPAGDFFLKCAKKAKSKNISCSESIRSVMIEQTLEGKRIPGLGHRVHLTDPRQEALHAMAVQYGIAGDCVHVSQLAVNVYEQLKGKFLPLNVDGMIGAIVADMGFNTELAKAIFILGRMIGLSSHYFEEIALHPPMRRLDFTKAVYAGKKSRPLR